MYLDPWNSGDAITAPHLNQAVEAMNKFVCIAMSEGMDFFQTPGGTAFSPQALLASGGAVIVTISITPVPTPGGLYAGSYGTLTLADDSETLDVESAETSLSTLVQGAGATSCYFIHLPEFGLTTHDLTDSDNEATKMCLGVFTGITTSDGFPVLAGVALAYNTCA